jgi:Tfp pilus assembly protein PilF
VRRLVFSLIIVFLLVSITTGCYRSETQRIVRKSVEAYNNGDYAKFREGIMEAYNKDPNDPFVLNNMGGIYEEEGNKAMALEMYKKAIENADDKGSGGHREDRIVDYSNNKDEEGKNIKEISTKNYNRLAGEK